MLNVRESEIQQLDNSTIVKRILAGEKALYEILIRRNNQKLYRVIRGYLKEETEIEDAMQNTYLKAWEKLFQFRHDADFATWLIRIGINEALFRLKEKGKVKTLHEYNPTRNDTVIMPDQHKMNPEYQVIRQEAKHLLEKAIDELEPKYRSIYILKEIEEMSIDKISSCLQISSSNVKVRLHRARKMLKEKLYKNAITKDIFEFGFSRCDRLTEKVMRQI